MGASNGENRPPDFRDIFAQLAYFKEKYNADCEVHISRAEDDTSNALLCITSIGICKRHEDFRPQNYVVKEVEASRVVLLPYLLHRLTLELAEKLDGGCVMCLSEIEIPF